MRELVGTCQQCGKEIFCMDGFLNGVHTKDGKVLCFDCEKDVEESAEAEQKAQAHRSAPTSAGGPTSEVVL